MSLSRVKTWNPGDVLTAADLNGEFNNVLNNPITLVSPTTGPINFNSQLHTNLVPSAIAATTGSTGQLLSVSTAGGTIFSNVASNVSRVTGLLGAVSSQSGTFSADGYSMRATGASPYVWSVTATSSFSASVGTAGPTAGGRDIAGAFASTYVHWYAITTGPGSTAPAGLVSTNPPNVGPAALPAGYQGWTYLGGSIYSSASTTCPNEHHFRGARAYYDTSFTLVSAFTPTTTENITSVANAVPVNAGSYLINATLENGTSTATAGITAVYRFMSSQNYYTQKIALQGGNFTAESATIELPGLSTDRNFYFQVGTTANTPTINISALSWKNPNGDV